MRNSYIEIGKSMRLKKYRKTFYKTLILTPSQAEGGNM